MRLLLTSGASELARQLAAGLAPNHDVRLTDRVAVQTDSGNAEYGFAVSSFGHDASTRLMLQDRDALVLLHHQGLESDTEHAIIDMTTRAVYNLLHAAVEAGLRRVVCISTLALMEAYAPDLTVSERWRPRPTTDPLSLGAYLTEAVCREFGREHKLHVFVLRIGRLVPDDATVAAGSADLRLTDLVDGVQRALIASPRPWVVYHLQSEAAQARFSTAKAEQELGYLSTD